MREALKDKMRLWNQDKAFLCFSVRLLADSVPFLFQGDIVSAPSSRFFAQLMLKANQFIKIAKSEADSYSTLVDVMCLFHDFFLEDFSFLLNHIDQLGWFRGLSSAEEHGVGSQWFFFVLSAQKAADWQSLPLLLLDFGKSLLRTNWINQQ